MTAGVSNSYFVVLGENDMLGMSNGATPEEAVALFCSGMDMFGDEGLEVDNETTAQTLLIPEDLEEEAEAINEGLDGEDALPLIEKLVAGRSEAVWSRVHVITKDGERICTAA
jgi:hypothetical protein